MTAQIASHVQLPHQVKPPPDTDTECLKCGSIMTLGLALVGAPRGITYEGEWPTRLKDCLKCHACGYSEAIARPKTYCEIRKPQPTYRFDKPCGSRFVSRDVQ